MPNANSVAKLRERWSNGVIAGRASLRPFVMVVSVTAPDEMRARFSIPDPAGTGTLNGSINFRFQTVTQLFHAAGRYRAMIGW
jgi:hypothetical protein